MTTRKAPRAFRLTEGEPTSEAINQPTADAAHQWNPPAITDELRRSVAEYIRNAREHAELLTIAARHDEPIAHTDEDVLDVRAIERLLDPMAGSEQRWPLFQALIAAGLRHGNIAGLDARLAQAQDWLRRLFDETCGWGSKVQPLLDNEAISDLTIVGTTVYADGPDGRMTIEQAYTRSDEPLRRAEFLVLAMGMAWNRSSPVVRLLPREGTRTLLMREPHVQSQNPDEPGFFMIIRRRRYGLATLAGLVEQGMLEAQGAALLTALLHAECSFLIGGAHRQGKSTLLEALANVLSHDRHVFLVEDEWHELNLPNHQIKTSLQVTLAHRLGDWYQLAALYRTLMRLRGDTFILDPGTLLMPDIALKQASAGVQTLATVEGERIDQIVDCFAREAAAVLHSPYSDADSARRGIGVGFQVAVQVSFSRRLQRHYVSEVVLFGGYNQHGWVITIPLFEAQLGMDGIAWLYHGQLKDRVLVWAKREVFTPSPIMSRLAHIPDRLWEHWNAAPLERPSVPRIDPVSREYERLLQKARAALEAGDTGSIITQINDLARAQEDPRGEALLGEALALPRVRARAEATLADSLTALRSAVTAWDLVLAQSLIEQPPADVLFARHRERSSQWQEVVAEVQTRCAAVAACQAALQEANSHRQGGDIAAALVVLRPISGDTLPPELRRTLLAARRALLTRIITQTQDEPEIQQQYVTELDQVNRALTPQLPAPASSSSQAAGASVATAAVGDAAVPKPAPAADAPGTGRLGWLDAALAHNRERARLRQTTQEAE